MHQCPDGTAELCRLARITAYVDTDYQHIGGQIGCQLAKAGYGRAGAEMHLSGG